MAAVHQQTVIISNIIITIIIWVSISFNSVWIAVRHRHRHRRRHRCSTATIRWLCRRHPATTFIIDITSPTASLKWVNNTIQIASAIEWARRHVWINCIRRHHMCKTLTKTFCGSTNVSAIDWDYCNWKSKSAEKEIWSL